MDENNEISEKTIKKYEFWAEIIMFFAFSIMVFGRLL